MVETKKNTEYPAEFSVGIFLVARRVDILVNSVLSRKIDITIICTIWLLKY